MSPAETVLVIGGAGYIGSVTVAALIENGYRVVVFDNFEKGHRRAIHPSAAVEEGDIRSKESIDSVLQTYSIQAALHFGAYSLVGESVSDPDKYFINNVNGGHNLLNAMREHGVHRIVFSSTAAVYGNPETVPITEDCRKEPINAYGRSKLAFEFLLKSYEEAYGIRHGILRYFNAAGSYNEFGEDHKPETHLIPLTLQVALGQREKIMLFGTDYDTPDGTCIRDYIHVRDLAQAHILALDAIKKESVICNLGNGHGYSVREVVETCREVTGHPIPAQETERRSGDPARLTASSAKAQDVLGWQPKIPLLKEIVETAWDWHKKHPNGYNS